MFKPLRYSALAFAALSPVLLLGCGAQKSTAGAASNSVAAMPGPIFSLDTPVERIAADPRGKVILDHDVPGLTANRSYLLFEEMSLSQIASVSEGRLSKATLDVVQADLSQLTATGKSGQ
jgi:hypothetical protein